MTGYVSANVTLSEAVAIVQDRLGCDSSEAERQLLAALRDGAVHSSGFVLFYREWTERSLGSEYWMAPSIEWSGSGLLSDLAPRRSEEARHVRVTRESLETTFPVSKTPRDTVALVSSSRKAELECREWIKSLALDGLVRVKSEVRKLARDKFGDRLSGRAFDRAWAEAAPLGWKAPGNKSKRLIEAVNRSTS